LRDEVKKGLIGRLKQGLFPGPAPIGYTDNGSGRPKTVDPVVGPRVRQLFEVYAGGTASLQDLVSEAARLDVRARSGVPLRRSQLSRMLRNAFYAGVLFIRKWGDTFSGIHTPLVSADTFQRVQRILDGKAPKKTIQHTFQFRRLLSCARCESTMIGERQKGHVYYRCQRRGCPTTTVREETVDACAIDTLKSLRVSALSVPTIRGAWDSIMADEHDTERAQREGDRLRREQLERRQHRLTEAYLDGAIDRHEWVQRKTALEIECQELRRERPHADEMSTTVADVLELADQAHLLYEHAHPDERRELLEIFFSNRTVDGRSPQMTLAPPFDTVAMADSKQTGGPHRSTARTDGAELLEQHIRTATESVASAEACARELFNAISPVVATADAGMANRIHQLLHPAVARPKPTFGRQAA
jgi:hypothetical protein